MSAMTDYTESLLAQWLLRPGDSPSRPAAHYLALHTSAPPEGDNTAIGATETTYSGYVRKAVAFGSPEAATGIIKNSGTVVFDAKADAGSVVITHYSIWDASSGGNCLVVGALNSSKTIDQSDVPSFPIDALRLTFA